MTVVCCWRDDRYGVPKISAIADGRLSSQIKDMPRVVHTDDAVKLFAAPVKCFAVESIDPNGVFKNPYYSDTVGLGFSGSALECLVVVAMIQRAFNQLLAADTQAAPEPKGLVNLADTILQRFMSNHKLAQDRTVRIMLFGWHSKEAWVGTISWWDAKEDRKGPPPGHAPLEFSTVNAQAIFWIGGHKNLGKAITTQKKVLSRKPAGYGVEADLAAALHVLNASKSVEDALLEILTEPGMESVGGVFSKMELIQNKNGSAVAFSADTQTTMLHALPSVSTKALVGPSPVTEPLGS